MSAPSIDSFINGVKTLPPAPKILPQLLTLLNKDDVHADSIVDLIAMDPALTAKVIQRCNSTSFGLAQPVSDISVAMACLGFNEVYRIVTTVLMESSLGKAQIGYGIGQGQLWEHSLVSAFAGRIVAKELGLDENMAFTASLLHDIGKLVLNSAVQDAQEKIMALTNGPEAQSLLEAEKSILGFEHAEVGGRILARWNFPEPLSASVWHHHDPIKARPHEHLASVVYVGDLIAHLIGYCHGHQAYAVRGRIEALEILEITQTDLELVALKTATAISETSWFVPAHT
jgi:putative nucleotidyltransferase with HDIG domain